jgi:hypothetical protein
MSAVGNSVGSLFGRKSRPAQKPADEMSELELRKLASRLYPYISQRLKVELRRDRERSGSITGLHR